MLHQKTKKNAEEMIDVLQSVLHALGTSDTREQLNCEQGKELLQ
jgi:hypothetical protein